MTSLLLLVLALPAALAQGQATPTELMDAEIRSFEADHAEALSVLASLQGRKEQVSEAVDLDALAALAQAEHGRLLSLIDDIYRRRNRFKVQANGIGVAVLAAHVSQGRTDRARFDAAMRYRLANDRMSEVFKDIRDATMSAQRDFSERLSMERRVRKKARALRHAEAVAAAVALLLAAALLRRRRGRTTPSAAKPPNPLRRPQGPARLE